MLLETVLDARVVLLQENIGCLQIEHSYKLSKVTVRSFQGDVYRSVSAASTVEEIKDVGDVGEVEDEVELSSAKVIY